MFRKNMSTPLIWVVLSLVLWMFGTVEAQGGYIPSAQTQMLLYDEARTVHLGNLARRDNGVPPLRWNRQLTNAARWFSWDSTENQPPGFCGHQDSQGHWPSYRAFFFGYLGSAGAENAFCGYVSPEHAIQGWMNSPGHRANLLAPDSREIGLGYYLRAGDGRGYVTQDFGNDPVYAPVIIENEAIFTVSPDVNLYIYDRPNKGGFAGLSPATHMMVSNEAQFAGAIWESYRANKAWTLANGNGWRDVFVKTRDKFNRTLTVSDTIYLGANVPLNELGTQQMSTTHSTIILHNLDGGTLPQAQLSLGWLADDGNETFNKWWGNGERVNDAAAWGGTAYRLYPGSGESFAWVYDTHFFKDIPLVAYFRLKVNDNTSTNEVARISVTGGGTEYGPLSLRGVDFNASNQYQEFALNFTFNSNPDNVFLMFNFWRSGSVDIYIDAVSIFTASQPITSPFVWTVPGNNYRGQGVWVRYTDGVQFSNFSEVDFVQIPTQIFEDVPFNGFARAQIESIYNAGITGGCSTNPLKYCPNQSVTRAQMAVFLLRGIFGSSHTPPSATGTVFADVPSNAFAAAWIEQMVDEGITAGCGGGNFCPSGLVTRAQMAVFLLRAKHGSGYTPPPASGTVFTDVPSNGFAAAWIEQLVAEGITSGCGGGNYCPNQAVTRAQMAVFLQRTFNLPMP